MLNDETIETAIDCISGFIIAAVSAEKDKPLDEIAKLFYASAIYKLLSDKETGYYWDSIPEMINKFYTEISL